MKALVPDPRSLDRAVRKGQRRRSDVRDHITSLAQHSTATHFNADAAIMTGTWDGCFMYGGTSLEHGRIFEVTVSHDNTSQSPITSLSTRTDSDPAVARTFSSQDQVMADEAGRYQIDGFVDMDPTSDAVITIWFAKLYPTHGWLYRGRLLSERGKPVIRGNWGPKVDTWCGTFELWKRDEQPYKINTRAGDERDLLSSDPEPKEKSEWVGVTKEFDRPLSLASTTVGSSTTTTPTPPKAEKEGLLSWLTWKNR